MAAFGSTRTAQVLACTPHFKDDAQNPWVTLQGPLELHYWFNPKSEVTLENVAAAVENFASSNFNRQVQGAGPVAVTYTVAEYRVPQFEGIREARSVQ